MALPTIIFVHGAWHPIEFFSKVISLLEPFGYKCIAIALPAVGRSPPVKSLDEEIAAVRSAVLKELDLGNNVIVNAHSWGGIPVNSALEGLSKAERENEGKSSAVVKLAFVSALLLPEGVSLLDFPGESSQTLGSFQKDDFQQVLYNDLPPKEAEEWVAKLRPQALHSFLDKTRFAAWKKIPSAYFVCENDLAITVQAQDAMVQAVKDAGGEIETKRLFVS